MRTDPMVVGRFHPGDGRGGLQFLQFDGDVASICVLLKKVRVWKGRHSTSNILTDQQRERRDGQLLIQGVRLFPVVLGMVIEHDGDESFVSKIMLASESRFGFEWIYPIWLAAEGGLLDAPPPLPLFQPTRITLKNPLVAPKAPEIPEIGIEVAKRREQALRLRSESERRTRADDRGA